MNKSAKVFIISGGVGASGEQVVHTVLSQFPENTASVITIGNVRMPEQVISAVEKIRTENSIIIHTLVDKELRNLLNELTEEEGIPAIDLMGGLLDFLKDATGNEPLGHPGLYRKLNKAYFDRVEAIDFAMKHDDGKHSGDLPEADIVLLGVSRVGKTPLCMYLSVLGWKAANVPVVSTIRIPEELYKCDPRRVFGLTIEPGQLLHLRKKRKQHMGLYGHADYTDPQIVYEEIEYAQQIFRNSGFSIIDVTDKSIESSSDEVIAKLNRRFPIEPKPG